MLIYKCVLYHQLLTISSVVDQTKIIMYMYMHILTTPTYNSPIYIYSIHTCVHVYMYTVHVHVCDRVWEHFVIISDLEILVPCCSAHFALHYGAVRLPIPFPSYVSLSTSTREMKKRGFLVKGEF